MPASNLTIKKLGGTPTKSDSAVYKLTLADRKSKKERADSVMSDYRTNPKVRAETNKLIESNPELKRRFSANERESALDTTKMGVMKDVMAEKMMPAPGKEDVVRNIRIVKKQPKK